MAREVHVVGIGASAGGLEALERFFEAFSPDGRFAFVVVQHLSPDFRSVMDELLARLIALTGYGSSQDRAKAIEAGFDDHLVKPVEAHRLLRVIDQVRDG